MAAKLTDEQQQVLKETAPVETPAEFKTLLATATPRMDAIVKEVQEPNQPVSTTLTETRDLLLILRDHEAELDKVKYDAAKRLAFLQAIRLAATAQKWFGDGQREGAFRARPVADVIEASRPFRARLKALGGHAFVFDQEVATQFADVNSTGTIEEEIEDLRVLNALVAQHDHALREVGLTDALVQEGNTLYDEASGRDLAGIIGVRNATEATGLRNRILTFVTLLAREARAAGLNACHDDALARSRFEASSFRNAMRAIRGRRGRAKGEDPAPNDPEKKPDETPPKG